jgi:hypothetical protein
MGNEIRNRKGRRGLNPKGAKKGRKREATFSPPFEGGVAGPLSNYDTKAVPGRGG